MTTYFTNKNKLIKTITTKSKEVNNNTKEGNIAVRHAIPIYQMRSQRIALMQFTQDPDFCNSLLWLPFCRRLRKLHLQACIYYNDVNMLYWLTESMLSE